MADSPSNTIHTRNEGLLPFTRVQITWVLAVILLGLGLRAVNITAPLLGVHSWRQADTAGVARNFHRQGIEITRPSIDWGGNTDGVVEMEMPIFNAVTAYVYGYTGVNLAVPRALAALGSVVGMLALLLLTRRWTGNNRIAILAATICFLLPYNIYFTRAIMPESWLLSTTVLGALLFDVWAEKPSRVWALLLSAIIIALAALIKLPALYIGLLLGANFWWRQPRWAEWMRLSPWLILFAAITLIPAFFWYRHASTLGVDNGLTFGVSNKWGTLEPLLGWEFYNKIIFQHTAEKLLTWCGLPLALIGCIVAWRQGGRGRIVIAWCAAVVAFFFLAASGVRPHEYYKLPITFPASILIAFAIEDSIKSRDTAYRILIFGLTAGLVVLTATRLPRIWEQESPDNSWEYALATEINANTDPSDLVCIIAPEQNTNPTVLYLADRKGWLIGIDSPTVEALDAMFDQRINEGATLMAASKSRHETKETRAKLEAILANRDIQMETDEVILFR